MAGQKCAAATSKSLGTFKVDNEQYEVTQDDTTVRVWRGRRFDDEQIAWTNEDELNKPRPRIRWHLWYGREMSVDWKSTIRDNAVALYRTAAP